MAPQTMFLHKKVKFNIRLTQVGSASFEAARKRLKAIYQEVRGERWTSNVSDGDVAEFLSIGEEATRKYLGQREGDTTKTA